MNIPDELIPIVFFILTTVTIKILSDNRIRRKLVEQGMVNENIQYLFANPFERQLPSSLKWGMVLIGIGLAILIGELVPARYSDEITFSMMFIMAGLALVIFYFIASRVVKQKNAAEQLEE